MGRGGGEGKSGESGALDVYIEEPCSGYRYRN